jgi:hypothetical protein
MLIKIPPSDCSVHSFVSVNIAKINIIRFLVTCFLAWRCKQVLMLPDHSLTLLPAFQQSIWLTFLCNNISTVHTLDNI